MGCSVSYLANAEKIVYFEWTSDDDDYDMVVEDIQEFIKSVYPEFENVKKYDGREVAIILEGYGTQIGLSEYCGLASLSIRVDVFFEEEEDQEKIVEWINENWEKVFKPWNKLHKLGTFSNGEAFFEEL